MRCWAITAVVACLVWPSSVAADRAELVSEGERLAKQGRLTEAIERFKEADRLEPRASHACLIALAYIRRELWSQAEIFLSICHERATDDDPLPDWAALADKQLVERLASANVAPVTIRVLPERLAKQARLAVSSFAPDELFAARTIHLPPGTHLVTGTVGDRTVQETIEIEGTGPREVLLDFTIPAAVPATEQRPHRERPSRVVPWTAIALGIATGVAGAGYHLLVFKPARDDLAAAATDAALYREREGEFDAARRNTLVLYGAGTALVLAGVVLRLTAYRDREEPGLRVSARLGPDGAILGLEWRR